MYINYTFKKTSFYIFLCDAISHFYIYDLIGLNFNQIPFSGVTINDLLLKTIGIVVFSQGSTSYLINSSAKANFISISANRFPKIKWFYSLMRIFLFNYTKQSIFIPMHIRGPSPNGM